MTDPSDSQRARAAEAAEQEKRDAADLTRLREHAKRELRSRMRSVRGVLPLTAAAERSAAALARLRTLPELTNARTVVAFSAIHKELNPAALLEELRAQSKRVGLPRVVEPDDPRLPPVLALHEAASNEALIEGAFGVREPPSTAPLLDPNTVDVIIVPGLAFDVRGHRIGYGRAFYDRLLPSLPNVFRIGIAYDFQLVPELPVDAHDVPMHCIVSDARVLRI